MWQEADATNQVVPAFFAAWLRATTANFMWDFLTCIGWAERELAAPRSAQAPQQQAALVQTLIQANTQLSADAARRWFADAGDYFRDWNQGELAFQAGDLAATSDLYSSSAARTIRMGDQIAHMGSVGYSGMAAWYRGDLDRSEAFFNDYLRHSEKGKTPIFQPWAHSYLGLIHAERGDLDRAVDALKHGRLVMAPNLDEWHGRPAGANRLAGVLAAARGNREEADLEFAAAMELWVRFPARFESMETLRLWGRSLRRLGDPVGANQKFDAALEELREVGAGQPWFDRVEEARAATD